METVSAFPDIPIIDHHCHVGGYMRPDGSYRSVEQHERQYARGFLEDKIQPEDYRRYVLDGCLDSQAQMTVDSLLNRSLEHRETTGFSRALRLGLARLHGDSRSEDELRQRAHEAQDDLPTLYGRALDLANCETVLSDVTALDRELWDTHRYRWIYRLDPYFYPFLPIDNALRGMEFEYFHERLRAVRESEMSRAGLSAPPPDLHEYLEFAHSVIERVTSDGAIGFKIVSAYVRSLDFTNIGLDVAKDIYDSRPTDNESIVKLSSFIARDLVAFVSERYELPIQIHVGIGHPEPGMDLKGVNPLHLQSLFDDESTRGSSFIMLHGGYPFCDNAVAMSQTYPNVYLDFSWMTYLQPQYLERQLLDWFEYLPNNKLMFGTDTGLPELHVAAVELGTSAVERALSAGVDHGVWSRTEAALLAERALRTNVADVYRI